MHCRPRLTQRTKVMHLCPFPTAHKTELVPTRTDDMIAPFILLDHYLTPRTRSALINTYFIWEFSRRLFKKQSFSCSLSRHFWQCTNSQTSHFILGSLKYPTQLAFLQLNSLCMNSLLVSLNILLRDESISEYISVSVSRGASQPLISQVIRLLSMILILIKSWLQL